MKRIFAMILSLVMVGVMFAACGDSDVYDRPGNGTTLGPDVTDVPAADDENGSYSADPDGDVNQTTDSDGMLENGMEDVKDGMEQGAEDLGDGMEDLGDDIKDGARDMMDGDSGADTDNGAADTNNGAGTSRTDEGDSHGATNGNSH